MYTYRITADGLSSLYSLSIPQLQGIYTYRSIIGSKPDVTMERVRTPATDPNVVVTPGVGLFKERYDYDSAMKTPLEYTGVTHSMTGRTTHYPPVSMDKPNGISIQAITTYRNRRIESMYISIITKDLTAFLSGFLLIQMICERSETPRSFRIYSSREDGYTVLSPLTGFPLLKLPSELINIITDYYPCDWTFVNRRIYAITGSKSLFDSRYPVPALQYVIKTINSGQVSDTQISLFAQLIRTVNINDTDLRTLLNGIDYSTVYPKIVDAVIYRYILLYDKDVAIIRAIDDITDGSRFNDRASIELFRYLIHNQKYSDILYFDYLDTIDGKLAYRYPAVYFSLLREGFVANDKYDTIVKYSPDEYLAEYTNFLLDKKGVFEKGPTNPVTGTTKADYKKRVEINVVDYIGTVIRRVEGNPQELKRTLAVISNRIDEIPDGRYLTYLLTILESEDIFNVIDENALKKIYRRILQSPVVDIDYKADLLINLENVASIHGYSDDLVNYIRSIPTN